MPLAVRVAAEMACIVGSAMYLTCTGMPNSQTRMLLSSANEK